MMEFGSIPTAKPSAAASPANLCPRAHSSHRARSLPTQLAATGARERLGIRPPQAPSASRPTTAPDSPKASSASATKGSRATWIAGAPSAPGPWGASRALDYFETDRSVNAREVGIDGHSRWGKAALVTMAYDPRFRIGYISSSGEGGAKLNRRNWGEVVENVAAVRGISLDGRQLPQIRRPPPMERSPHRLPRAHRPLRSTPPLHRRRRHGRRRLGRLPRHVHGSRSRQPRLPTPRQTRLGVTTFPPLETPLIDGDLGFRQHAGGHTPAPNWPTFITFASRYLSATSPVRSTP